MYPRILLLLGITALALNFGHAQELAQPPAADYLVSKNIEAKGGQDAILALTTVKLTGKLLLNDGQIELGYLQTKKQPGAVRTEVTLQGMTAVQAFDGTDGWKISPFQGRKDPEKMSSDDLKSMVEDAEIAGPLFDWKAKGETVTYVGREDVDGTDAYKLKVVRKNGDVNFVYLDPDYFLEIRVVSQRMEHGAQVEVQTDFGDYEKVNGVFLPFAIEAGAKNSSDKQKVVLDKVDGNVPVDDSTFKFPATSSK